MSVLSQALGRGLDRRFGQVGEMLGGGVLQVVPGSRQAHPLREVLANRFCSARFLVMGSPTDTKGVSRVNG